MMLMNLIHVGYYYDHVIVHGFVLFVVHYDLNLVLVLYLDLDPGLFPFPDLVHDLDQNSDPILLTMNNWMSIDGYVMMTMMLMMIENDHHHLVYHHNLDHFVHHHYHFDHIDRMIEMIVRHNHHNQIVNVYGYVHHNPDHMMMFVDLMDVVEFPNQVAVGKDENLHYQMVVVVHSDLMVVTFQVVVVLVQVDAMKVEIHEDRQVEMQTGVKEAEETECLIDFQLLISNLAQDDPDSVVMMMAK